MKRLGGLPALCAASLILAFAATPSPAAPALHSCAFTSSEAQHFGPTYVTSLRVVHVSCVDAKRVLRAYHACRAAHGGIRGRCPATSRVLGYRCHEQRGAIKTQFSAKVTCTSGHRIVQHTYTQFT